MRQHYSHLRLLLVGTGSNDLHNCEADLRQYVAAHGLQDSVTFTGNVENVQDYLKASDIFVFPTTNEAFGISLIEAMACGLPVISTPVGGVKDILEHDQNGLMVKVDHFQELYARLEALITNQALAGRLGQAARQTAQNNYSAPMVVSKYAELFQQITANRASLKTYEKS